MRQAQHECGLHNSSKLFMCTSCVSLSEWFAQEEIYSSSYAAAAYLESVNFPKEKKVLMHSLCCLIQRIVSNCMSAS